MAAPSNMRGRGRGRGGRGSSSSGPSTRPVMVHEKRPDYPNVEVDVNMGNKHSTLDVPIDSNINSITITPHLAPAPQPHMIQQQQHQPKVVPDGSQTGTDEDDEDDEDDGNSNTGNNGGDTDGHDDDEEDEEDDDDDDDEDEEDEDDKNDGTCQMNGKTLIEDHKAAPDGIRIPDPYQMYQQQQAFHPPPPPQMQPPPPPPMQHAKPPPSNGASFESRENVAKLILIERIRRVCPKEIRDFDRRFNAQMSYDDLKASYQQLKVQHTVAAQIGQWRTSVQAFAWGVEKLAGMQNFVKLNMRNWHQTVGDQLDNEEFDGILAEMVGESSADMPAWQRGMVMLLGSAVGYNMTNAALGVNQSDARSLTYSANMQPKQLFANQPPVSMPAIAPSMHPPTGSIPGATNAPMPLFASSHSSSLQTEPQPLRSEEETRRARQELRAKREQEQASMMMAGPPAPIREETKIGRGQPLPSAIDIDDYCSDPEQQGGKRKRAINIPKMTLKLKNVPTQKKQKISEDENSSDDDESEDDEESQDDEDEDDEDGENDENDDEEETDEESEEEETGARVQNVRSIPQHLKSRITAMRQKAAENVSINLPKRVQHQPGPPPAMDPKAGPDIGIEVDVGKLQAL